MHLIAFSTRKKKDPKPASFDSAHRMEDSGTQCTSRILVLSRCNRMLLTDMLLEGLLKRGCGLLFLVSSVDPGTAVTTHGFMPFLPNHCPFGVLHFANADYQPGEMRPSVQ